MMKWISAALLLIVGRIAAAGSCAVTIATTHEMRFDRETVQVDSSCTEIEVTFVNAGSPPAANMKHNWVLARADDVTEIAAAGMKAGSTHDYQKPEDPRIVAATKLVDGGERATVSFSTAQLEPGTKYAYFCSVPGHYVIMQGELEFAAAGKQDSIAGLRP